jgi:hypothetical protein
VSYGWLSFLTDYGLEDGFVAACHGVIARIAPTARVIDISHAVPAGDIRRGAAVLAQTLPALPPAVHVAVVDPGVGTERRPLAIAAGTSLLVGPDNGLLIAAAEALGGISGVHVLANQHLWLHPVSPTFHGRDVFSPVAARLATGTALADVGPAIDPASLVRFTAPAAAVSGGVLEAAVVAVDRFGNVQVAAKSVPPEWQAGQQLTIESGRGLQPASLGRTFGDVAAGDLVVFVDSAGHVAAAVNGGRADALLDVAAGSPLRIAPAGSFGARSRI